MGIQKGFLMIEQPNTQGQRPRPGRLVLPVHPAEEQGVNIGQLPPAGPSQYAHFATTSTFTNIASSFQKLGRFWRKDAAYKVLMIAVAAVMASGILFIWLGCDSSFQGPRLPSHKRPEASTPSSKVPRAHDHQFHPAHLHPP